MNDHDLIQYIDFTDLSEVLDERTLTALCETAQNAKVAALCIQKQYIGFCKEKLGSAVSIASVFNFPYGNEPEDIVLKNIDIAIRDGADELDIVIPLLTLESAKDLNEFKVIILNFANTIRAAAPTSILKFIISTDVLTSPLLIKSATEAIVQSKADFVKTCTGKTGGGLTIGAVKNVLEVIGKSDAKIGFKASGGIKTVQFAKDIYKLTSQMHNLATLNAKQFRIGASSLLPLILCFDK